VKWGCRPSQWTWWQLGCGGCHLNGLDSGFTVTGKFWACRPNLASLGGITCCLPACASWGYCMVSMHSCQLLIFIQPPQVEPRGHLIPLIQWTLQFVHNSCQVKGLHADSKGVGFRKSPLLTGTKLWRDFNTMQKLTIWYKGKEVTRMRLTQSLDSLSSLQIRVYPWCFNLIDPTTNTSLKNSCVLLHKTCGRALQQLYASTDCFWNSASSDPHYTCFDICKI
jgi:hypothetical protein